MSFASVQNWLIRKRPSINRPKKKYATDAQVCSVWSRDQKPSISATTSTSVPGSTQNLGTFPTARL
jgi:hypothetical protein